MEVAIETPQFHRAHFSSPKDFLPPENMLEPEQRERILKHGANETIFAMCTSPAPLDDPLVACPICFQPYHNPNVDGEVEVPVITACGHIFGHNCLKTHIESRYGAKMRVSCPMCRFELHFKNCKHVIAPLEAFASTTPGTIKPAQIPENCLNCELDSVNCAHNQLIDAYTEKRDDAVLFIGFLWDPDHHSAELDRLEGLLSRAKEDHLKETSRREEERRGTWSQKAQL